MRDQILKCLNGLDETVAPDTPHSKIHRGDFELNPSLKYPDKPTPAAVLVPLVEHENELTVLFTKRTDHLNDHAGQISFPGGRMEATDSGPVDTALRETREEIGMEPDYVKVAGCLDHYETGTGYLVLPVVGFVRPGFQLVLDEFEVADVFEVPLSFLLDADNHRTAIHRVRGMDLSFHVIEYQNRYIWGATAGMLMNFYQRMQAL